MRLERKCILGRSILVVGIITSFIMVQLIGIVAKEDKQDNAFKSLTNLQKEKQVLSENEEKFKKDDRVTFIVELEQVPVVETRTRSTQAQKRLLAKHDEIRNEIQKQIAPKKRSVLVSQYDYTYIFNGFTLDTTYGNKKKIENVKGVKNVFVSQQIEFLPPDASSNLDMVGAVESWKSGYTGKGKVVAVIDTGLDLDHEVFSTPPADPKYTKDMIQEKINTNDFNAKKMMSTAGEYVWKSDKIPFQFDYADKDANVKVAEDGTSINKNHGTHVAGIIGGSKKAEDGKIIFSGVAPDVQICFMKVSPDKISYAPFEYMLAAMEDAALLDVDEINMSTGTVDAVLEGTPFVDVFDRITQLGINFVVANGNDYTSAFKNGSGENSNYATDPDRGISNTFSNGKNIMSVASKNNDQVISNKLVVGGEEIPYLENTIPMTSLIPDGEEEADVEFVEVPNFGEEGDYANIEVKGKIAAVKRGDLTFDEKTLNAQKKGAIGVLILNTDNNNFKVDSNIEVTIPVCAIQKEYVPILEKVSPKKIKIIKGLWNKEHVMKGEMSDFSALGTSSSLRLVPSISGVGDSIYSSIQDGYDVMSGTSMASPQIAGLSALLREYLTKNNITNKKIQFERINQLLMSTAIPVTMEKESDILYSPRKQGAGLANIKNAITSEAYLSIDANQDRDGSFFPRLNLFDNVKGEYNLRFSVNNTSNSNQTYTIKTTILKDSTFKGKDGQTYISDIPEELVIGTDVTVDGNGSTITVAPGEHKIDLLMKLTDAGKEKYNEFVNGGFIEGFVQLIPSAEVNNNVTLSIPFLGFFGNWSQAPILEESTWYNNVKKITVPLMMFVNWNGEDTFLGTHSVKGNYIFDPELFSISPNNDGSFDKITNIYFGLKREASKISYRVLDNQGKIVYDQEQKHIGRSHYDSNSYGMTVPVHGGPSSKFEGKGIDGKILEDGKYTYQIKAEIAYEKKDGNTLDTYTIPLTIDTKKPNLSNVKIVEDDEKFFIEGKAQDENPLMGVGVIENDEIIDFVSPVDNSQEKKFRFDVSDYKDKDVTLYALDYAYNEINFDLTVKKTSTTQDPSANTSTSNKEVGTGDSTNVVGWLVLFTVSVSAMGVLVIRKKRTKIK